MSFYKSSSCRLVALSMFVAIAALLIILGLVRQTTQSVVASITDKTLTLGAVTIKNTNYIAVIESYEFVGRLFGESIFEVVGVTLEPVDQGNSTRGSGTVTLVEDYLESAGFYFSNHHQNPSLSAQCTVMRECSKMRESYFIANEYMLQKFNGLDKNVKSKFEKVKAIRGHVEMGCLEIEGKLICVATISRTCTKRTSTRYASRGGDEDGNVSNFVETELVTANGRDHAAFVQIRGSMPFRWAQKASFDRLNPNFFIDSDEETHKNIFQQHTKVLNELYRGSQIVMLSLVNQTGRESVAGQKFAELFNKYSPEKMSFIPFDYHAEVPRDRGGWVAKVVGLVQDKLGGEMSFYYNKGRSDMKQSSIVRTNCVDCLDRTNAVQTQLAKHILSSMLKAIGVTPKEESMDQLLKMLGRFWANNADVISHQYVGSRALKTDIARTGHRTKQGMLRDLLATIRRHANANYFDRFRKEAMAIVYGPDSVDKINLY